jgi:hypothetical protein
MRKLRPLVAGCADRKLKVSGPGREFFWDRYRNTCIARVLSRNYFVPSSVFSNNCPEAGCAATKVAMHPAFPFAYG